MFRANPSIERPFLSRRRRRGARLQDLPGGALEWNVQLPRALIEGVRSGLPRPAREKCHVEQFRTEATINSERAFRAAQPTSRRTTREAGADRSGQDAGMRRFARTG